MYRIKRFISPLPHESGDALPAINLFHTQPNLIGVSHKKVDPVYPENDWANQIVTSYLGIFEHALYFGVERME